MTKLEDEKVVEELEEGSEAGRDKHRVVPGSKGGTYSEENVVYMEPVEHLKHHDSWRDRTEELDHLKSLVDDRNQILKLVVSLENRIDAFKKRRTDHLNPETLAYYEAHLEPHRNRLNKLSQQVSEHILVMSENNPLITSALGVPYIGPITVAYCTVYLDLEKADHASSLWAYAGYDKPAYQRYKRGEKGGGNRNLRTALYNMAMSQIRAKNKDPIGPYAYLEEKVKAKYIDSERITHTRVKGGYKQVMWKDASKGHRHNAACREIAKHFLADYWYVGRTLSGLPTDPVYPVAVLGGAHRMIMPEERGWVYEGMKLLH